MTTKQRWAIAQSSEKKFWDNYSKEELYEIFEKGYSQKAKDLEKEFSGLIELGDGTKILQIGCAALDVINYLEKGKRHAIDPLTEFYKEKFKIDYGNVEFIEGSGEELPYEDSSFDIVILANVLDHVQTPDNVLSEVKRVLKSGGIMYIDTHFANQGFRFVAKIWGVVKRVFTGNIFNINHPHIFSLERVKRLLEKDFDIIKNEIGKDYFEEVYNFEETKQKKRQVGGFGVRTLARLGAYGEITYSAFCRLKWN